LNTVRLRKTTRKTPNGCWKTPRNAQESTWLGSLDLEMPLEGLLYRFGPATRGLVGPYGNARLSAEQWTRPFEFARQAGYPTDEMNQLRAGTPVDYPEGMLVLLGD